MKTSSTLDRTIMAVALTGVLALLGACGSDPPPASGASSPAVTASPEAEGLKPRLEPSLQTATANSPTVTCNVETIGGQTLEGVNPKLVGSKTVGIAGWYFVTAASGASAVPKGDVIGSSASGGPEADTSTETASSGGQDSATSTSTTAAANVPANDTVERGLQLLIANESGSKQWVVALPTPTERPDVAAALSDPTALNSGFAVELNLAELAPGFYSLHLSDAAHSAASVCGLGRGFILE